MMHRYQNIKNLQNFSKILMAVCDYRMQFFAIFHLNVQWIMFITMRLIFGRSGRKIFKYHCMSKSFIGPESRRPKFPSPLAVTTSRCVARVAAT